MIKYNSSIDVSINCTGMCITDENMICEACIQEISNLKQKYESIWDEELLQKCNELYEKALQQKQ